MTTLHIEHAISDFDTWQQAFDRFADFRRASGVRAQRVLRPVDDPNYIVIQLDFDTVEQATSLLAALHANVWSSTATSPALVGRPQTRILEPARSDG